ncbi:methyltransferase domain-containing protein [Achromobacter insuavis]
MNATANPALGYPYFPYYPVVLDILRSRLADSVLDAPCDRGWLGDMARPATGRLVEVDGIGPAALPAPANGYRRLTVHDLETPLPATVAYDAVVCSEAIHRAINPGLLVRGFRDVLRPGGTLVLTAPNAWHVRGRLQALLRGFHADPWTGAGRADARRAPRCCLGLRAVASAAGAPRLWRHHPAPRRRGRAARLAGAHAGLAGAALLPDPRQARAGRGQPPLLAPGRIGPVGARALAGGVGAAASLGRVEGQPRLELAGHRSPGAARWRPVPAAA